MIRTMRGWVPPNIAALLMLAVIEYLAMAVLVIVYWRFNQRQSIYQRPLNYALGDGVIWLGFVAYAAATGQRLTAAQAVVAYSALLGGAGTGTLTMYGYKWWQRAALRRALDAAEAGTWPGGQN